MRVFRNATGDGFSGVNDARGFRFTWKVVLVAGDFARVMVAKGYVRTVREALDK